MRIRVAVTTAVFGLRAHRGTAILLVVIAAAGLAALLPVALLIGRGGSGFSPRLLLESAPAAIESGWTIARTPDQLHAEALRLLFQALAGAAFAAFAVSVTGVLLLFAARASERVGETTLRRAVGAPRRTLFAAALVEGGVLAALAIGLGSTLGVPGARVAAAAWPGALGPGATSPALVAFIAMAAAVLAGAALALVFAPRRRLTHAAPQPLGLALPSTQLAAALVLLTASALLVRQAASRAAVGARPAGGEVFAGSASPIPAPSRSTRYAALLESLKAGTEFDSVSLVSAGTLVGLGTVSIATTDCGICPWGGIQVPWHAVPTTHRFVSADTFQALGVHLIAGRGISRADTWDAPRVAVVSRALALRHFQNGDAIGRRMLLGDDDRVWHTVVGIVDDPATEALGSALLPAFTVYASVLQHPPMNVELLVRRRSGASGGPDVHSTLAGALGTERARVHGTPERALVAAELTPVAWFGRQFAAEGWTILGITLLTSLVQISLWVRSRASELGLRRAVGATRRRILGLILLRAAAMGAVGTAGGVVFGPAVWGALGTIVRGLPRWDTPLVLRFAVLLVAVSMVGALVPAWRTSRTEPARLLALGG